MRRRHLESVSAALYGSTFQHLLKSPIRIQPQLSGKGVLGHSPKCVLPTFAHTKVGPRRAGVQALHPAKSTPRRRVPSNPAPAAAVPTMPLQNPRPAEGEMKLWHNLCHQFLRHGCAVPPPFTQGRLSPLGTHKFSPKILLPPFHHGKAAPQPRPLSIVFPGALW